MLAAIGGVVTAIGSASGGSGLLGSFTTGIQTIASKVGSVISNISSTISSCVSNAISWGKDLVSNIASGISSAASKVINAAKSLASSIKSILGFSLPEKGPLSDADEYMPDFLELMRKGIVGNESDLLSSVRDMAAKLRESMGGLFGDDFAFKNLGLPDLAFAGVGGGTTTTNNNQKTTNLGGVNIYVTGSNNQSSDDLAKTVADKINDMLDEDNSVFK